MVLRKNLKIKYALISVYDKNKLNILCKYLSKNNFKFISTGSTAKKIISLGYKCIEVSKITQFREILDGRVKTLNPKLYGSILYLRNNKKHIEQFKSLKVPRIDLVIVNLYPFEKFIKNKDINKTIEMIDIGGPSLIRAASKNFKYVTTIFQINDYEKLIQNLSENNGTTNIKFRKRMAGKAFKYTSKYDHIISTWFNNDNKLKRKFNLRYGENPNQNAYIINDKNKSIFNFQISGKKMGFNNIIDVESGLQCLKEFTEPSCVIIKHNNPCAVASSVNIESAFKKAFSSDSISAFGGIVLLNRKVEKDLAIKISKSFFEIIVATSFDKNALDILKKKNKLILLKINKINFPENELRSTIFGNIYQTKDNKKINKNFLKLVSYKKASNKLLDDLVFASKVVKHLKSNAIVVCAEKQTLGIGCGQTNRIDSLRGAIKNYKKFFNSKKFICVSDGFFPFTDSLKLLKNINCKAVAQPSGSLNDAKNIEYANNNNLPLYFLKNRLFKH